MFISLLVTASYLRQSYLTHGYILRTNASQYAFGAALLQGKEADERLVEFSSRLLTPAERNYSTIERKGPCIVLLALRVPERIKQRCHQEPSTPQMANTPEVANRPPCMMTLQSTTNKASFLRKQTSNLLPL